MRNTFSKICIAVAAILSFCGCANLYQPQLADVPLIDHKGDFRLSMQGYLFHNAGLQATVTTGLTNHLSVQAHSNLRLNNCYYGHLAMGFFFPIDEHMVFETYVGCGQGHGEKEDVDHSYKTSGTFTLPFLQCNFGLTNLTKAHIDFGASLKGGVLVPDFHIVYSDNTPSLHYMQGNWLIEPQLFFRIGGEHIKYNLQLGFCWLNDMRDYQDPHFGLGTHTITYTPISLSMGVSFYF